MEASKCPRCGEEPHFVEQVEKWYCYACNEYVEDADSHLHEVHNESEPKETHAGEIAEELKSLEDEDKPACGKCGAILEKVEDGKLFCFICESFPEEPKKQEVKPEVKPNEAQALIDSITVPTPVEAKVDPVPVIEPPPKKEPAIEVKMCSTCGQPLKYIEKYRRHYCYGCRKYAPKEGAEPSPKPAKAQSPDKKLCPDCGKELRYVEKYSEHYCFNCKKYPFKTGKNGQRLECPKCGQPLRFIEKYSRHYCLACKEYAPKGYGQGPQEKKICPCCNEQMRFIAEYNEWYCYKCKKYSLRPSKPVLLI